MVDLWQKVWDPNHEAYYYWHSETNEVTWTEPPELGASTLAATVGESGAGTQKTISYQQAPPEAHTGHLDAVTTEKRSRSPSDQTAEYNADRPKSKSTKLSDNSDQHSRAEKSERANRVREIMIKLGMGKDAEHDAGASTDVGAECTSEAANIKTTARGNPDELSAEAEMNLLIVEVRETLAALPSSQRLLFNPVDVFQDSMDGSHSVHDATLIVNARIYDWQQGALRHSYLAGMLRQYGLQLRRLSLKSVVAAQPAAPEQCAIEKKLPPASGIAEPLMWLTYMTPNSSATDWNAEEVASHFQSLRGIVVIRTIGQGFFGVCFSHVSSTDVLVQLAAMSISVPSNALDWRLLSDGLVYARQAATADHIAQYPATYTFPDQHEGIDAPSVQEKETAPTTKLRSTKTVSIKQSKAVKKMQPMIFGKWQAARAEIEDYEKRNKKESEMSFEELEELRSQEVKQWREKQDMRSITHHNHCPLLRKKCNSLRKPMEHPETRSFSLV